VVAWSAVLTPKNARGPVAKLCLALETFRRTDEGRTRDARAFLGHFFPYATDGSSDRLFVHMPREVRAALLSSWGIRGAKSALRDDDEKVRVTIADALAAGDIDATEIEDGVSPETLIDWVPLEDWWTFWRGASLPARAVRRALAVARELSLFDDRWFLDNLKLDARRLAGMDVICAALSKERLEGWLRALHASADASPAGLVAAVGWETILANTAPEALTFTLDALARQIGLAGPGATAAGRSDTPRTLAERPGALVPLPADTDPVMVDSASGRTPAPVHSLPSVFLESDAPPAITASAPPPIPLSPAPSVRTSFGSPIDGLPPMRPPARTLSGIGEPSPFETTSMAIATTTFQLRPDPAWAPPRAEPGDMGGTSFTA
jgi:hypothetical protein